ncbi:hypothetical protein HMSSN139_39460 [Paenibacillus sp. HMSSN-139]|nr:hypothetical protein HMSSN139_39460 [Paenibacillus sp. HMSSN-139]
MLVVTTQPPTAYPRSRRSIRPHNQQELQSRGGPRRGEKPAPINLDPQAHRQQQL